MSVYHITLLFVQTVTIQITTYKWENVGIILSLIREQYASWSHLLPVFVLS